MLQKRIVFSGFYVDDTQKAKEFHSRVLGPEAKRDV
jgi:hypothetical protein